MGSFYIATPEITLASDAGISSESLFVLSVVFDNAALAASSDTVFLKYSLSPIVLLILAISIASQNFFQAMFLSVSGFSSSFFVEMDFRNILIILLLSVILFILTYFSTKYIFKA